MQELIDKCSAWSLDRKIIQNSSRAAQCLKLMSEMGELADNIGKGRDTRDDIGDCLVVLNNLALMQGKTLADCLAVAYEDIKDRKGYMSEQGLFIKEGDQ